LQRIVTEETVRCPLCEKRYPKRLPGCPHCAADPRRLGTPGHTAELLDEPTTEFAPEAQLIRLPTPRVVGILLLSIAAWASVIIMLVLGFIACVNPAFFQTV